MRLAILPLTFALASCGTNAPEVPNVPDTTPTNPLDKYAGLIGEWVDSTSSDQYVCYERWAAEGDSALVGVGHVVAGADTVFLEELRLAPVEGHVTYAVRSGSQNEGAWVHFSAEPTGADTLMFENAKHDFPQCITYTRMDEGWYATVTGTERGKERLLTYRFQRR